MSKFIKVHITCSGVLGKCSDRENTEAYLNLKDITFIQENGKMIYLNNGVFISVDEESFRRLLSVIECNMIEGE